MTDTAQPPESGPKLPVGIPIDRERDGDEGTERSSEIPAASGTPVSTERTDSQVLPPKPSPRDRFGPRALRNKFRRWRKTRPFWAGIWAMLGAVLITYGPATAFRMVLVAGDVVWLGMLVGVLIGIFAVFLWFMPGLHYLWSVLIVIGALVSLITSDLGGFLIGMVFATIGGSLGMAWTDDPRFVARRHRRIRDVLRRRPIQVIDLRET